MDKEIAKIITSKIMELQDENGCWNVWCEVDHTEREELICTNYYWNKSILLFFQIVRINGGLFRWFDINPVTAFSIIYFYQRRLIAVS